MSLKQIICRQYIVMYCYFYIQSGDFCLLISTFRLFTFNVIIGMVRLDLPLCLLCFSTRFPLSSFVFNVCQYSILIYLLDFFFVIAPPFLSLNTYSHCSRDYNIYLTICSPIRVNTVFLQIKCRALQLCRFIYLLSFIFQFSHILHLYTLKTFNSIIIFAFVVMHILNKRRKMVCYISPVSYQLFLYSRRSKFVLSHTSSD